MNLSEAKAIANRIHKYVMDKRKDPVGNQNCLLCVWCSEAQFRDIDILPRPVYSPRDSIFTHIDRGLEIVENPVKLSVSNITELKKKVLLAFNDARYYCHVNWNGSEGGHEFILLLLTHKIYVMDSQAGLVVPIESDKGMYYFTDINWSNTFIARMDDKKFNKELLYRENNPHKIVEWDTEIDIPYMRKHGMIPDADHTMRDATEKDLEFITFSELETVDENKNDPKVVKYIKQDAKDSLGHTKIIVVNGEDVGVYQAYATNKWGLREGKKDWWYLAHIYIKPEYRGMGIGTNIIKKDIREHDKILLQVMKSNPRARKLYESLGFKFSQENDHGGIIMRYEKGKSVQESFMDEYDNPLSKINKFFDSMKDFEYGFYADGKKYTGDILDEPNVFDKYHLMSSEEIEQHKVCVCWDACRYEAEWFKNNLPDVEIRTYYCEYEPKIGNTHTWLVFKLDDKWYVFEYTWYSKRGIKEISSPEALADEYIRDIPLHEHSPAKLKDAKYVLIEYDPLQDKPGISCVEFMDRKWHNGTLIKTNCKSEEELIDTFEFTNEKWKPQFELSSIQEFVTQETYIAPTDKLIPIPDYPYDKVYMGTSTKFIPTKDVYFVTQSIANASIFSGRDKVYPELRKRGIYQYNLGYSEWGSSASEPLKTVHIIVEKGSRIKTEVPYFEPFEFTATGYIHKIDLSKMKDHIYKYDWMTDECEACVVGIDKLDIIKTTKVTITYKVCHEKDRRKLINESYEEGELFLMDNMNESYVIVDDEDIVQESDAETETEDTDESMTIDDQPDIDEDDSDDGPIEPEDVSDNESEESDESKNENDDEETIDINTMSDPLDDYADDFNPEESKEEDGEKVEDEMIDIPGFDGDDEEPVDAIEKPNIDEMISKDNNTPEQTSTQPTEPAQTIDIGINVSGFGSDNSPVQNQYDPKEIERLNTLVASENSAIGEYFQASKATNVDVLRRLFSDIGEEERFHVEQLLFAKSQITGERYIPRDPNIKKEYEELLAMGMNEEDAMNTAADKVGLMRTQQAAQADAVQEMVEMRDKIDMIETMIDQDYMLYTIAESVTSFDDVDNAMQTFVEAYLGDQYNSAEMILEAVGNVGDPKPKPPKNKVQQGPGVLNAISQFFSRIIQNIGNILEVVVRFIKKQVMIMKQKASWYKNHSLPDIFRKGFNLYFYNDSGDNAGFAYSDAAKYLIRLIYCCLMVAKQTQPPIGFDYGKDRMRFNQYIKDDFRPKNLDDAINSIKNIVMRKTKVIINDDNKEGFLKEAFGIGGSADNNNGSGAYENFRMLLSDFKGAAKAADKLTKDLATLKGDHNSMYFKEDGRKIFDKLVSSMKTIVKGFQMFLKCINSDIKTLISLSKAYTEVNVSEDELPTVSNEEVDKLINIAKSLYEDNIAKINQITSSSASDSEKIAKLQELITSLGGNPVVEEFAVDEVYQEADSIPNNIDYKSFVKMSGYDENKLKNIISGTIKRACLKIINNIKTKSSSNGTKTNNGVKPNENNGSALKAKQALKVIKNTMNPEFHDIRNILLSDKYSSGFNGSTKADVLKRKRQEIYSKYKNVFNESFSDIVDEEIITEAASPEAVMAANMFKKGNLQYQLVDELRNSNINDIGGFATYCEAKKYSEAKVKSLVYAIIIKMIDKIIPKIGG